MANSSQGGPSELKEPQAAGLFETPLLVANVAAPEPLNRALRDVIEARQAASGGVEISNLGGWQSDTRMMDWGGAPAQQLCRHVFDLVDRFTVDIRAEGKPRHRWLPEMWANVSPPGAANRHHCHPGAYWSAVYYVDDGYGGSADRDLGGELVLFDPRMPMVRMTAPDLRFRRPGQGADHDEVRIRPATGRIVVFPAWLNHAVQPYKGTGLRVSVAVNLLATAARPAGS